MSDPNRVPLNWESTCDRPNSHGSQYGADRQCDQSGGKGRRCGRFEPDRLDEVQQIERYAVEWPIGKIALRLKVSTP